MCYNSINNLYSAFGGTKMNIGFQEDLLNEFKSDRKKLSDSEIIDAIVAFANTDGGNFYLGIEDNGEITGLHTAHQDTTQLAAYIANKTVPPVAVRIEKQEDNSYLKIIVTKSRNVVAASSGKVLRRRSKADSTPENVPMYPFEINSRLSDLGMLDFSSLPVPDSEYSDLDSIERERLRNIIRKNHGEANLLELTDEELDKSLRLAVSVNGKLMPTYCGMLLIGRQDKLKEHMPTAESAFQVMSGTEVIMNETYVMPILSVFEKIELNMSARNSEMEIEDGLFRISVPDFDKRAFREAVVNAFSHRDYTMMGMVRILLDDNGLTISNPGGFIEGISMDDLLNAEPRGRNPALADVLKRIGLAERTGRGIDRIYEGSLVYGRPLPDYSESSGVMVKLFIPRSLPDETFIKMISEEQRRLGHSLPINTLLILNELKRNRKATIAELSRSIHIGEARVRNSAESLVETGILEATGQGRSRAYMLSAKIYKRSDNVEGYVRQKGIDRVRFPEMIMQFAEANHGQISRGEAVDLLRINEAQAYYLLKKLVKDNRLRSVGKGKNAHYEVV